MSQDLHEKRFGIIAVEKGYITEKQLVEALSVQVEEELGKGKHRLIGVILYGLGYMTKDQALEVLEVMKEAHDD